MSVRDHLSSFPGLAALALAGLLTALPAAAVPGGTSGNQMAISQAVHDTLSNVLTISGENFGADEPSVTLAGLTDGSSAGDWRLPAIQEWRMKRPDDVYEELSIIDTGCSPSIPNTVGTGCWGAGDPFDNVESSNDWSATSDASYPSDARNVNLGHGSTSFFYKAFNRRVVAVRGGR